MKKYVIDTNALISFVTDRNLEQQVIVKSVLESGSRLKGVVLCHTHVLTEFVNRKSRVARLFVKSSSHLFTITSIVPPALFGSYSKIPHFYFSRISMLIY